MAISAPHEDGKADYSAEVAALQASGAEHLIVLGYVDQGGGGIVQASLDTGAFESFFFADGMYGQSLIDAIGDELNGKVIGTLPGTDSEGARKFAELGQGGGHGPDRHLRAGKLRRGGADRARHRRRRLGRPHRHQGPGPQRRQRAGRADLRRRARQGPRDRRRRQRHRLPGRHRRRADRPGRGRRLLPRVRDQGQRRRRRSTTADRATTRGRPAPGRPPPGGPP